MICEPLSATVTPAPVQGQSSTVDIKIKNNGNTTSPQFLVDWNPDANGVSSPSLQTVTYEVDPIASWCDDGSDLPVRVPDLAATSAR